MKIWIVIVAIVATRSIRGANAYYYLLKRITRNHIYSPDNDMISIDNYTQRAGDLKTEIVFKQTIDKDNNPMMISATIMNTDTSKTLFTGGPYNICENQKEGTWDYLVVRLFRTIMLPRIKKNKKCPVPPAKLKLFNYISLFGITLDDELDMGNYSVDYSAKTSENQCVISSMEFAITVDEPPSDDISE